jgi:hypothetical protein
MATTKKICLITIFFIFSNLNVISQDNLVYFMGNLPQSNYLNPARLTDKSKVVINLPLLSGMEFTLNNSFSFYELAKIEKKTLIFDMGRFYSNIPHNNFFSETFKLPLFGFQYRSKDKLFSLRISETQLSRFGFDSDLIKLINKGNNAFLETDFSTNIDFKFLHFREYSLGYSQNISDKLTIGSNIKLLTGFSTVDVKRLEMGIKTGKNIEYVKVSARGDYNVSFPVTINPDSTENTEKSSFDAISYFTNSSNLGFAIDLGARYQLLPELEISASIIDLGYIHWKSNVSNISQGGSFNWRGFDLTNFYKPTDLNEEAYVDPFQSVIDSLKGIINPTYESNPFNTGTPTKLYLAANYKVSSFFWAGIVDKVLFFDKQVSNSLTLSGNLQLGRIFSLSAGYSIIDKSFNNLALGTALKLGPIEIYCLTGNILALNVLSASNFNFQFGMNLMFGKNIYPKCDW